VWEFRRRGRCKHGKIGVKHWRICLFDSRPSRVCSAVCGSSDDEGDADREKSLGVCELVHLVQDFNLWCNFVALNSKRFAGEGGWRGGRTCVGREDKKSL